MRFPTLFNKDIHRNGEKFNRLLRRGWSCALLTSVFGLGSRNRLRLLEQFGVLFPLKIKLAHIRDKLARIIGPRHYLANGYVRGQIVDLQEIFGKTLRAAPANIDKWCVRPRLKENARGIFAEIVPKKNLRSTR